MTFPPAAPHGPVHPSTPQRPAPGTDLAADLGAALSFAGRSLLRNPVPFLVSGLVYSLVMLVIIGGGTIGGVVLMVTRLDAMTDGPGVPDQLPLGELALLYGIVFGAVLLAMPFALLWQSGSARAAETILEGGRPTIGAALAGPMRVILTALLVGAIVLVGTLLCYLPGLAAAVLLMFSVPAAARGASPVAALSESVALVRANLGTAIVAYLVLGVISSIAGSLIIGLFVAVPFMLLFEVGMYERLNGRSLPEPARA